MRRSSAIRGRRWTACRSTSSRAGCPKLLADGYDPVSWPAAPGLEWAPPGHGEVFASLASSGLLAELLERGYEHLFLSNSDNLGAVLEPRILGWFAAEGLPFVSEVVDRTEGDRKGGHLARRRSDGQPARDGAGAGPGPGGLRGQRPPLLQLQQHLGEPARARAALAERGGVLELPMIVNRKTVDPTDPTPRPR